MGRPTAYKTADGKRVPGVTTILGRFKEAGGLIHWAWNLGIDGVDYRDVRDSAASIGHAVHGMAYAHAKHLEFDPSPYDEDTMKATVKPYGAFLEWATDTNLRPGSDEAERPMVSEKYRYGGTPDDFFIRDVRTLADWKTSNAVYPEYLCQLAAYRNLWIENHPDEPIDEGAHLIRFDKEHGDFHHHRYTDLEDAWRAFVLMRELYELDKKLKKRVG